MYVGVGAYARDPKRYFYFWDQFNKRWEGPFLMDKWDAGRKVDWWRDMHPEYYKVGTDRLLENPHVVYWDGKQWRRWCQFEEGACTSRVV